jgi:hypothetical protein
MSSTTAPLADQLTNDLLAFFRFGSTSGDGKSPPTPPADALNLPADMEKLLAAFCSIASIGRHQPAPAPVHVPSPRRQAAGKLNRQRRRGLTEAGREKLRQSAREHRPWQHSTGPRTAEGKERSSENGRYRQQGVVSKRQQLAEIHGTQESFADLERLRDELLAAMKIR